MFGRKRINETVENLDKFFDIVDQALLVFEEGVRNYLFHNSDALSVSLQSIGNLVNDSELLSREIETALYRQGSVVRLRGDILRLLERLSHLVNTLNSYLYQFEIERPGIPSELNADFLKLLEFSTKAVATTIPVAKDYFRSPDSVSDKVRRVYFYHKEADRQAKSLKRRVFHDMDNLKLSEKIHLRYFALHIEELAIDATKVADQLSVMSIRRVF